ncbi:hypothetical protein V8C86DRAFT_3129513 [Haematococcus lacustris]
MAIGRGSRGGRRGSGISTGAGTQQVANRGGIATGLARGRGSVQKAGRGGQQFTGGRGEGRRGGRGRGGRSGRGRGKPRSAADLDDDLNGYFMRDKDQGAKHLDQELDEYFKTKPTNQAKPAAVATEPAAGALPAKGKEYPGLGYKRLRDKPPKAQEQQQPAEAQ